jgi:hypothetical protein
MAFKQDILNKIIGAAQIYKSVFMDFDYLVSSGDFTAHPYYTISAVEGNFVHLTGVHALIPANDFYAAALDATLQETDFDFADAHKSEKSVKSSVKRKLKSFLNLPNLFSADLRAEENFVKGRIHCTIGTTDSQITVGFINSDNAKPKTLLKGDHLNQPNSVDVSIVLRRKRGADKFDTVMQSDIQRFCINNNNIVDAENLRVIS